jgi:CBS domain-containing protein
MKVKEIMNHDILLIKGDSSIQTASQTMKMSGIDTMPVIVGKSITGMITSHDIEKKIFAQGIDPKTAKVADGMTERLFACSENDKIKKAADKMNRCRVNQLAVMNQDRQLVGLVSSEDIDHKAIKQLDQ